MAFDFPANPVQNQEFTPVSPTGHTYIFKNPRWVIKAAGTSGGIITVDWDDITNLPPDFPPSAHTHPQTEVDNLVPDLAAKAPLASPDFIGVPRAPTAVAGTADTQIASTQFVAREISSGAFTDAPSDGSQYARQDAAWAQILPTDWADITNPPVDFPATAHTHPQADVTNLVTDLALKAPLADPALTGVPTAPTAPATTATTQLATTAFVQQELSTFDAFPEAPVDTQQYARQDAAWSIIIPPNWATIPGVPVVFPPDVHTHPQTDVTNLVTDLALKAPLASPALTGVPTAPTAVGGTSTTQLATTEFVEQAMSAVGVPVFSTDPEMDLPTPSTTDLVNPQNVRSLVGDQVINLTTVNKTIVPAINETYAALSLLAQGHEFVATFKADAGTITWTASSAQTGDTLPAADAANKGWYLICDAGGSVPPGGAPLGDYAIGDWLISNGTGWVDLDFSLASAAASNIILSPAVGGATDVQAAITNNYNTNVTQQTEIDAVEAVNVTQQTEIDALEAADITMQAEIDAVEVVNTAQDTAIAGKEAAIPLGLATDYWNGLKAWVPMPAAGEPPLPAGGLPTDYLTGSKTWAPFPPPAPPTIIADDPPVATTAGQLWWESDTGNLLIWYDDGTSPQWVATGAVGPAGPAGPAGLAGPPWVQITQQAYDALVTPDPLVMYMIIG